MEKAKNVEEYLGNLTDHKDLVLRLRAILHKTELKETLKWRIPSYQINGKNVVGIGAFKSYAGLWFYNGSFLKDASKVLINAQVGKTRGMRQWRFSSIGELDETLIRSYVLEAIQNQKDGKEIKPEKKPLNLPDELKEALSSDVQLFESFEALTLTLKREFAEYIKDAKREQTKIDRLQKIIPMIQNGIGLNDKYMK